MKPKRLKIAALRCLSCKRPLRTAGRGRPSKYCSDTCKAREFRRLRKVWETAGRLITKGTP